MSSSVILNLSFPIPRIKKKELWTGIVAAVVIIGTSVFCPPAGLALATVYGGLEAGTAIVGKDWLTGRKLDNQERTIRGMFSALDLIPGLKAFTGGTNLWQASLKGSKMASMTVKQAGTIARESAASRIRQLGDLATQTKQAAKSTASRAGTSLQNGIKKIGQIIDRYGDPFGKFTSPVENGKILAYDTRGLPYPESAKAYHQYEVVKDINMENVQKAYKNLIPSDKAKLIEDMDFYKFSLEDIANPQLGKISKVFGAGGGIQIQLGTVVDWYEKLGLLKEIK